MAPFAEKLVTDLTELKSRLGGFTVDPTLFVALPGDMAQHLADGKIQAGEDRYSGSDLDDLAASLEGISKLVGLQRPILAGVDPALESQVAGELANAQSAVDALGGPDGFPPYAQVDQATRAQLAESFAALAQTLARTKSVIGGG